MSLATPEPSLHFRFLRLVSILTSLFLLTYAPQRPRSPGHPCSPLSALYRPQTTCQAPVTSQRSFVRRPAVLGQPAPDAESTAGRDALFSVRCPTETLTSAANRGILAYRCPVAAAGREIVQCAHGSCTFLLIKLVTSKAVHHTL